MKGTEGLSVVSFHLLLAKFSVGYSIPFNDFHGNVVQVCLSIKHKHVEGDAQNLPLG